MTQPISQEHHAELYAQADQVIPLLSQMQGFIRQPTAVFFLENSVWNDKRPAVILKQLERIRKEFVRLNVITFGDGNIYKGSQKIAAYDDQRIYVDTEHVYWVQHLPRDLAEFSEHRIEVTQ